MPPQHRLAVCTGKDCRNAKGFARLLQLAADTDQASTVPCQDICQGPVVGLERGDELRWYAKVRGDRRRALARVVRNGRGRRMLRSFEVRSRRGRIGHPDRRRPLRPGR